MKNWTAPLTVNREDLNKAVDLFAKVVDSMDVDPTKIPGVSIDSPDGCRRAARKFTDIVQESRGTGHIR